MKATLLIGAPGAGKSRWWFTNHYCSTRIRLPLPTNGNWAEVKGWLNGELKQYSAIGREIVVEGTFCSSEYRKSLVKTLRAAGYTEVVGIVFPKTSSSKEYALELQERLRLCPPSLNEGFDNLTIQEIAC